MIVDSHAHIRTAEDAELGAMLRAADRAGVDKVCISSLGRQQPEFPSEADLDQAAGDVLAAVAKHPDRFVGYAYVSADHVEKSLEVVERTIANGPCRLVKLWVSQYADDVRLDPIMARIEELDVPVMAHTWMKATGNMTKESTYDHVVRLGRRHPGLKVWLAHYGGRWEEAARVVRQQPNVCMDVCGGEPEDRIVECLLKHVGPERLFYGSDAPGRSFVVQMTKVTSAGIPEESKKLILGDNIRRWIRD
ncbi:MAG: amidohydrolase [Candidatus Hydrogenedentes bacterium]|nr:amidohydrolase [Candidatus Hydrogenedentota bacterium]